MKPFEFDGVFWLSDYPDKSSVATLSFSNQRGIELDVMGILRPVPIELPLIATGETFTIHGTGANRHWTIFRAQSSSIRITDPGISREKYHSPLVLSGKEFLCEKHLRQLTSVHLQMQYLLDWVGQTGLSYEFAPLREDGGLMRTEDIKHIRIIFTPISTIMQSMKDGIVEIAFPYTSNCNGIVMAEGQIKQLCSLGFRWNSSTSIHRVLEVAHSLQDLLALSTGTPPLIENVHVTCADFKKGFELFASDLSNSLYEDSQAHIGNWIFTLDSFGGIEGVANWLNISQRYRTAINTLLSVIYTPNLYMENKLVNIMIAAEAFERVRCNTTSKLNLKTILENLVQYAGDIFIDLVGETQTWINKAIRMRHEIVHRHSMERLEIFWLDLITDSSYWLIIICLLKECRVNDTVLQQICNINSFKKIKNSFSNL